jgi:hypothetical protein
VASSDAATEDLGTKWAIECAARYKRPLLVCAIDARNAKAKVEQRLATNPISTLNIAGPSEGTSPGIGDRAYHLLHAVLRDL